MSTIFFDRVQEIECLNRVQKNGTYPPGFAFE